mgnify:CR=1 FL=1
MVLDATHQRFRIHRMRNALAHAPAKQRTAVAAIPKTIFAQETKADAEQQWGIVADTLREKQPELGALMDVSREDVPACTSFPRGHWAPIASTNPLERVNRELKRRADVIGIFPDDEAIVRLVGALILATNDEWAVARRYMSLETLARVPDNPDVRSPLWLPDQLRTSPKAGALTPFPGKGPFSVDGTLVKAWASVKSFQPKAGDTPPDDDPGSPPGPDATAKDHPEQPFPRPLRCLVPPVITAMPRSTSKARNGPMPPMPRPPTPPRAFARSPRAPARCCASWVMR